jgi:hypothetical protein
MMISIGCPLEIRPASQGMMISIGLGLRFGAVAADAGRAAVGGGNRSRSGRFAAVMISIGLGFDSVP